MSIALPAGMAAQVASGATTWAWCVRLITRDGMAIALTEHDEPLTIDLGDGAVTYDPSDGLELSQRRVSSDLTVDNVEAIGAIDDARITPEDVHGGRFDYADVALFIVNWQDPAEFVRAPAAYIGETRVDGAGFVFELRTLTHALQNNISRTITADCPRSFGSTSTSEHHPLAHCGVVLEPPVWQASTAYAATEDGDQTVGDRVSPTTANGFVYRCTVAGTSGATEPSWPTTEGATVADGTVTWKAERALVYTGSVTAVSGDRQITASGVSVAADFFSRGYLKWTTGANAAKGVKSPIAADDGAGTLTLYRAPIEQIQPGDSFKVFRGCDRSHQTCIGFSNWKRFGGFPYVPPRRL